MYLCAVLLLRCCLARRCVAPGYCKSNVLLFSSRENDALYVYFYTFEMTILMIFLHFIIKILFL